jgi:hypothetical protein
MLDLIDLPSSPLRHGPLNNTHKTHTANTLVVSPGKELGFLNLKCGFDSRRGHCCSALIKKDIRQIRRPHATSENITTLRFKAHIF